MVDYIRIKATVPIYYFVESKWKLKPANKDKRKRYYLGINSEEDNDKYEKKAEQVYFEYYPQSEILFISGRVISSADKNHYKNYDDFKDAKNIKETVYRRLNMALGVLFLPEAKLDVRKMKVTQIEYSFNIETEYKDQYIRFLNKLYKLNKDGKFRNYVNFTDDKNKKSNTSFYLKTKTDYENRTKRNFCLNIYNKHDNFLRKVREAREKNKTTNIVLEDIVKTYKILRIECKAYHEYIESICKRENIKNNLQNLMDINVSKRAITHKLEYFFGKGDFCKKKYAIKKFKVLNLNVDINTPISELSKHYAKKKRDAFETAGICPYGYLPECWGAELLPNPIKLIEKKVDDFFNNGGIA